VNVITHSRAARGMVVCAEYIDTRTQPDRRLHASCPPGDLPTRARQDGDLAQAQERCWWRI